MQRIHARVLRAGDVLIDAMGQRAFRITHIDRAKARGYIIVSGYPLAAGWGPRLTFHRSDAVTIDGAHALRRSTLTQAQICDVLNALGRSMQYTLTDARRVQRFFRQGELCMYYDRLSSFTRELVDAVTRVVPER